MGTFAVILPAAGRSTRFGDPKQKKIYAELDGRAVWLRALDAFLNRGDVGQIVVAIAPDDRELFERRYRPNVAFHNITVVDGGAERPDSIARALEAVEPSCDYIAVHDAARPCLTSEIVDAVFAAALEHGAAVPGVAVADTLKRVDADGVIVETVPRTALFGVQTPQAFRRDLLVRAYDARSRESSPATDDATLVEALGHPVRIVDGSPMNIKITTAADLRLALAILQSTPKPARDAPAHPFADEQSMWGDLPKKKPGDLFS
jgi:2-C-methyl-D-erythritol 4-phosphate cytidylyltransferase